VLSVRAPFVAKESGGTETVRFGVDRRINLK